MDCTPSHPDAKREDPLRHICLPRSGDATKVGSTSPGIDGISVDMLKATWPSIGEYVRQLYETCLRIGYYLQPWKEAEVVMVPKPRK